MAASNIEITLPGIPPYRLLYVPRGEFCMGSAADDQDAQKSETPPRQVHLKAFYLGEFQVTQDLWKAVMGKNPSSFEGERRPVESISWNDIKEEFLPKLRKITGDPSWRLPTEAEWEYAARGGPYWESEGYRFSGSDLLEQVGWYDKNSNSETHDVGLLLPNALGLYDMSGNVWEWCEDSWHDNYNEAPRDGSPWMDSSANSAVLRGGSWFDYGDSCRVARRNRNVRDLRLRYIGFRLARAATEGGS